MTLLSSKTGNKKVEIVSRCIAVKHTLTLCKSCSNKMFSPPPQVRPAKRLASTQHEPQLCLLKSRAGQRTLDSGDWRHHCWFLSQNINTGQLLVLCVQSTSQIQIQCGHLTFLGLLKCPEMYLFFPIFVEIGGVLYSIL